MPVEAQPVAAVVDTTGAPGYLSIRDLRKEFDGFVAVDDVNLDVRKGEIFALLGGSGSGNRPCCAAWAASRRPPRAASPSTASAWTRCRRTSGRST
jgi:ABC-type phosphonate transport system ATPase subunit